MNEELKQIQKICLSCRYFTMRDFPYVEASIEICENEAVAESVITLWQNGVFAPARNFGCNQWERKDES